MAGCGLLTVFLPVFVPPVLVLTARLNVLIPLGVVCLAVVAAIPSAARRGKLNLRAYAGMMVGAAVIGFSLGHVSGLRQVRGTPLGVGISILFFLLVAAALGCLLSLFLYREP
jgi:hypothetical protein